MNRRELGKYIKKGLACFVALTLLPLNDAIISKAAVVAHPVIEFETTDEYGNDWGFTSNPNEGLTNAGTILAPTYTKNGWTFEFLNDGNPADSRAATGYIETGAKYGSILISNNQNGGAETYDMDEMHIKKENGATFNFGSFDITPYSIHLYNLVVSGWKNGKQVGSSVEFGTANGMVEATLFTCMVNFVNIDEVRIKSSTTQRWDAYFEGFTWSSFTDEQVPNVGGTGTITPSFETSNSMDLSWQIGNDDVTQSNFLQYKVVRSDSNNLSDINTVEANGTTVKDWTDDMSSVNVSGLSPCSNYYFNVIVRDEAGKKALYQAVNASTLPKVTTSAISIAGASGTGGAFVAGDTVTATWNNTSGGDNNSAVSGVTMNFSEFGGGTAVVATNSGNTWTASYTLTGSLSSTARNVSVTVTGSNGKQATVKDDSNATVDTIAPAAPSLPDLDTSSDLGASSSDNITDVVRPVIKGTTEIGSTVTVTSDKDGIIGTAVADGGGSWSILPVADLSDGTHTITAKAKDSAGNVSDASAALTLVMDSGMPVTSGTLSFSNIVANGMEVAWTKATDTYSADSALEYKVVYSNSDNMNSIADAEMNGTIAKDWSAGIESATLTGMNSNTTYYVAVLVRDQAGNRSLYAPSSHKTDYSSPVITKAKIAISGATGTASTYKAGDTVTAIWDNSASGDNNSDITAVTFDFTAFGGSMVSATEASGIWTATYTITSGSSKGTNRNVAVKATNAYGKETITTDDANVTVDNTVPAVPVISGLAAGTDSGVSNSDGITNMSVVMLEGTAEAGCTIHITNQSDVEIGFLTVDGSGHWAYPMSLMEGTLSLKATAVDEAGNSSTASGSKEFKLDTTAASMPVVTIASNNIQSQKAKTGNLITVHLEASETIQEPVVQIAGHVATIDNAGDLDAKTWNATITMQTSDTEGSIPFTVEARDLAGNITPVVTTATNASEVIYDKTLPGAVVVATATNAKTAPIEYTVTFSEPVTGLTASDFSVTNGTVTGLSGSGSSYTVSITPSAQGQVQFTLPGGAVADSAGNVNVPVLPVAVNFDSIAPVIDNSNAETSYNTTSHILIIKFTDAGVVTGTGPVDVTKFTLGKGSQSLTLTSASSAEVIDSSTIRIVVAGSDLAAIQGFTGGEGIDTVSAAPGALTDICGNTNVLDAGNEVQTDFAPSILSASRVDATHIRLVLSESCNGTVHSDQGGFSVEEKGNALITYSVTATAKGESESIVILTTADASVSAKEGLTVQYTPGGSGTIQDKTGNPLVTSSMDVAAWDTTAPGITASTLAPDNSYVDLTFSEGVYGSADGVSELTASDLSLVFTKNLGTAVGASISSVKKQDSTAEGTASPLTGGETMVRVFLSITGTPSGLETIKITPANTTALFDKAGNAVPTTVLTGDKILADKAAPTVVTLTPIAGATAVERDTNLVLTFDSTVTVGSGVITLKKKSDNSTIETITASGSKVTGNHTSTITINPSVNLDLLTEYYVEIGATAFADAAGNYFPGIADSTTWSFTTRTASTNALLVQCMPLGTTLTPAFDPAVTTYTGKVANSTNMLLMNLQTSANATVTVNSMPVPYGTPCPPLSLMVGSNIVTVKVTAEDGTTTKTYTFDITREAAAVSSGPSGNQNSQEITVNVTNGDEKSTVAQIAIIRATSPAGQVSDTITYEKDKVAETISSLKKSGNDTARIIVPDMQDIVSETRVQVPSAGLSELAEGNINLELNTANARIQLSENALDSANHASISNLYFNLIPVRDTVSQQQIMQTIQQDEKVMNLVQGQDVDMVGRPITIETNLPSARTTVVLPISQNAVPKNEKERAAFLNKLAVYIEHSDGTKEIVKGIIVPYKEGVYGIQFTITKFSTFTIISSDKLVNISNACKTVKVIMPSKATIAGSKILATVSSGTKNIDINLTVSKNATWSLFTDAACTKAIATKKIALHTGGNKVYLKVTAQDGTTSRVYTMIITRKK